MKGLLLGAVLVIACWPGVGAGVPVQKDFDHRQLDGKWYAAGIVKTNGPPEHILVLDHIAESLPNGDLLMRAQIHVKNKCKEEKIRLVHTNTPGVFTIGTKYDLSVVKARYGSYYIFHIEMHENSILQLFVREPDVPIAVKNTYQRRVRSLGFKEESIIYLNTIGIGHPLWDAKIIPIWEISVEIRDGKRTWTDRCP